MSKVFRFGSDFSHSDYVVPMAKISTYDSRGVSRGTTMYIRMGGTFSTSIRAAYEDAQGIFGTPFTTDQNVISKIGSAGVGFVNALQAQLTRAYYGARGTIVSAGLSGRQQIEFLSRVFLSNFQQVVYRGPSFRMFTLPFVMKPTSLTEAKDMREIIATLKLSSSPKIGTEFALTRITNEALSSFFGGTVNFNQRIVELQNELSNTTLTEEQREVTQAELNELQSITEASDSGLFSEDSPLTFGYPDVCEFELVLVKGSAAGGGGEPSTITTVFKSKKCVIESVVADYGSSNKMTFFDSSSNEYYPTEVNLTLNLKELEFQTDKTIQEYSNNPNYTIL
jgi:hypothetical protein